MMQRSAMRRVEDKIRSLSEQLLSAEEGKELGPMLVELREALHQHIERLRVRFAAYPIVVERRVRNEIPSPVITAPQGAINKNRPTSTGLKTSASEGLP
jgi:hypothetical protein